MSRAYNDKACGKSQSSATTDDLGCEAHSTDLHGEQTRTGISSKLDELVCTLVGGCLDVLADEKELWPTLAFTAPTGEPQYFVFNDDELEECLNAARARVAQLDPSICAYAIAYDGFIQDEAGAGYLDALLVEFGERHAQTAYSLYVPYWHAAQGQEFISGEPLAAGEEPLLLL